MIQPMTRGHSQNQTASSRTTWRWISEWRQSHSGVSCSLQPTMLPPALLIYGTFIFIDWLLRWSGIGASKHHQSLSRINSVTPNWIPFTLKDSTAFLGHLKAGQLPFATVVSSLELQTWFLYHKTPNLGNIFLHKTQKSVTEKYRWLLQALRDSIYRIKSGRRVRN